MKHLFAGAVLALVAAGLGCSGFAREPNWRNITSHPMETFQPEPDWVYWVSPALTFEEMPDHEAMMRAEGWTVVDVTPVGLPAKYVVTYRQ